MKRFAGALSALSLFVFTVLCASLAGFAETKGESTTTFQRNFTGKTLRFDYFHSGNSKEDRIAIDQFRVEGEWAGSRTQLTDDSPIGHYLFEVFDAGGKLIYSHSFSSIFGEWQTTGEAKKRWGSFHESLRFPEPRGKFSLRLQTRHKGKLEPFYETDVDPEKALFNRSRLTAPGKVWALFDNGPPATKVDLLVLGDGYTAEESNKFQGDVERLIGTMFEIEPFKSRRSDFSVRAVGVAAAESEIRDPRRGIWRNNPLGLSFNSFGSDRYVLTYANQVLREYAALAPYDALIVIYNGRKYGGGGIYNLWATAPADSSVGDYVFVHEFGHSFAGLADEYYTSSVSYEDFVPPGTEPAEPNATALLDPENLKWKHLVEPGTPLPTKWSKKKYEKTSIAYQKKRKEIIDSDLPPNEKDDAMEALFAEVKNKTTPILQEGKHAGKVGAFEGASYQARGLYRPSMDCIMFTRNHQLFCPVCHEAVNAAIDRFTR